MAQRRMQRTALQSGRPVGALRAASLPLAQTVARTGARRTVGGPALRSRCTPVAYVRGQRQPGPDQRTAAPQPGAAVLAAAVRPACSVAWDAATRWWPNKQL